MHISSRRGVCCLTIVGQRTQAFNSGTITGSIMERLWPMSKMNREKHGPFRGMRRFFSHLCRDVGTYPLERSTCGTLLASHSVWGSLTRSAVKRQWTRQSDALRLTRSSSSGAGQESGAVLPRFTLFMDHECWLSQVHAYSHSIPVRRGMLTIQSTT